MDHAAFHDLSPKRWVPPGWIKRWARAQVDAGADLVFLTGSPVLQGVEIYRNRPILYNLGNFIFNCPGCGPEDWMGNDHSVYESVIVTMEFEGKTLQSVTFRPIVMSPIGRGTPPSAAEDVHSSVWTRTRGVPAPATGERARVILNRLADVSWPFGTWVEVNGNAAEIRLK